MKIIRRSEERGRFDHGWLQAAHTFSFGEYVDRRWMGYRTLRVINQDQVAPGQGFGTHGHRDMEIITYVTDGVLAHKDSMGNGAPVHPGEVQYMSAGSGVRHSEFNGSSKEPVRLLQIWIEPTERGAIPRYAQLSVDREKKRNVLFPLVSADGKDGTMAIRQDAAMFASVLDHGQSVKHPLAAGRAVWVQLISGGVQLNGESLRPGDGIAIEEESAVIITGVSPESELLLFDLGPMS